MLKSNLPSEPHQSCYLKICSLLTVSKLHYFFELPRGFSVLSSGRSNIEGTSLTLDLPRLHYLRAVQMKPKNDLQNYRTQKIIAPGQHPWWDLAKWSLLQRFVLLLLGSSQLASLWCVCHHLTPRCTFLWGSIGQILCYMTKAWHCVVLWYFRSPKSTWFFYV